MHLYVIYKYMFIFLYYFNVFILYIKHIYVPVHINKLLFALIAICT